MSLIFTHANKFLLKWHKNQANVNNLNHESKNNKKSNFWNAREVCAENMSDYL